ncbi:unnamed protein product [Dicrocoelium dendriticum]|nr:unnamed protein product [Dicrocoelium dendriticum]
MGASGRLIFQVLVSLRSPVLSLKHNPGISWRSLALSVLNSVSPSDASSGIHKSRTHKCGHLSTRDIGKVVCIYGWVHRIRLSKFLILRDSFGYVQVRLDDAVKRPVFDSPFKTLSRESVVNVTGTVAARPPKDVNKELPTGEIEVLANEVNVINPLQLQCYLYLDLRSSFLQRNLKFRSDFVLKLRNYLCDTQVETPCLFRRTPGVDSSS